MISNKRNTLNVKRIWVTNRNYRVSFINLQRETGRLVSREKKVKERVRWTMTNFINPYGQFKHGKCAQLIYIAVLVLKY